MAESNSLDCSDAQQPTLRRFASCDLAKRAGRILLLFVLVMHGLALVVAPWSPGDRLFFYPVQRTFSWMAPASLTLHELTWEDAGHPALHAVHLKPRELHDDGCVVLQLHGNADRVVPLACVRDLYARLERTRALAGLVILKDGTHLSSLHDFHVRNEIALLLASLRSRFRRS